MFKTPFEFFNEFYKDKIKRDRKTNEFIYSQTDNLIAWVIGFAFTGLLLLIANIKNLELSLRTPTKPIIICISITIFLGIAFRYVSFLIMTFEKGLDDYYAGLFSKHDFSPVEAGEEIDNADFDKILLRIKEDFDQPINYTVPITDEFKRIELPKLVEHYKKLCENSKKSFDVAMNHIAEVELTTHRIDKKKNLAAYANAVNATTKIGYNEPAWSFLRSLLFTLCLLAFLIGILIVCFSLLFMKL